MDWCCSYLCSGLIPSVTKKSVIFVKELSVPQTAPTDDAIFQPDWAKACGVIGPDLDCCWTSLLALDVALLCKNKKEEGSARASPVAAQMSKSISF